MPVLSGSVVVNIWLINEPDPGPAPVTLVDVKTVQLNVVPVTLFGLPGDTEVVCPEHIDCGVADAVGTGRTVTTKLMGAPVHVVAFGVIV